MKMRRYFAPLLGTAMCLMASASASAATPEQMDHAKAIAYKYCLRYMNNGSGYLDDTKPANMAELRNSLKQKEQENIKTLESIALPPESEYSKWDKEQFNKFWEETFFSNKKLNFNAKGACKKSAIGEISKISVTKSEAKPEEKKEDPANNTTPAEGAEEQAAPATPAADPANNQDMQALIDVRTDTVVDAVEIPIEEVKAQEENKKEGSVNYTAIIILCALVLVVVLLVAYALNAMKRNKERSGGNTYSNRRRRYPEDEDEDKEEDEEEEDSYRPAPRRQSRDNSASRPYTVQSDMAEESAFAAYSAYTEPVSRQKENHDAYKPGEQARSSRDIEIEQLRNEVAELRRQLSEAHNRNMEKSQPVRYVPGSRTQGPAHVIYLARANRDGVFTRADARYNPGTSIFKLITSDGVSGSFSVIDDVTVCEMALLNPEDCLLDACSGRNLDFTRGARDIVTEASGTAIFENGRWCVMRKARIAYTR